MLKSCILRAYLIPRILHVIRSSHIEKLSRHMSTSIYRMIIGLKRHWVKERTPHTLYLITDVFQFTKDLIFSSAQILARRSH